jgi:hypothetical protein
MRTPPRTNTLILTTLAALLLCFVTAHARADVRTDVDQDSQYAKHFKVKAVKAKDVIRVTLTVPRRMEGYDFEVMAVTSGDEVLIRTNGTELEFVIDASDFAGAIAHAGYIDPDHNRRETGGGWSFALDLSSLSGEDK